MARISSAPKNHSHVGKGIPSESPEPAVGMSTIHVNRVLRQLRERGLVTVKNQTVVIEDMPATKMLAGYLNRDDGAFPG